MGTSIPFLVHLKEAARETAQLPPLSIGADGLLRRVGSETPIIDELRTSNAPEAAHGMITTFTEAKPDQPDPDLVRLDVRRLEQPRPFEGLLGTLITRAEKDIPDPDVMRAAAYSTLVTTFTNGRRDRPDPDVFRQ